MRSELSEQNVGIDREAAGDRRNGGRFATARFWRIGQQLAFRGAALLLCLALERESTGQTYSVLHSFGGEDGAYPESRLVLSGSALYGTTCGGGISNAGTVFKVQVDGGGFAVLHHFTSFPDGANPQAGLALAGANLYGTTCGGGLSNFLCRAPSGKQGAPCGDGGVEGGGTIFKINTDASDYLVLHRFAGPDFVSGIPDGLSPQAGLFVLGSAIYGATFQGGNALCPGAVFTVQTDGSGFAVLKGGEGPWFPDGGLTGLGPTLYGTTCSGGNGLPYGGTVFSLNADGTGFRVLKGFLDGNDGAAPYGDLLLDGNTLYGTTSGDGEGHAGNGTVFRINVDGSGYMVLKNFSGTDGASPRAGLVLVGNSLFGTTRRGGSSGQGTVFRLNTDGSEFAVLKSFSGGPDGANPFGELVMSGGTLYGTTAAGGANAKGVVFSISYAPSLRAALQSQTAEVGTSATFKAGSTGALPLTFLWFFNSSNLLSASTNACLQLTNVQSYHAGAYAVIVTNVFGAVTSAPAMLSVIPPVPRRPVPALSITGQAGYELNLDARTGLTPGENWSTIDHVFIETSPHWYFDLSTSTLQRFYRVWQAGASEVTPSLDLHMVPAITVRGNIGLSLRLDYIAQFGPIDAWVTLDTITVTNTTQLYFDISAPEQPPRLYRLIPVP